jgi:hypothetical protein
VKSIVFISFIILGCFAPVNVFSQSNSSFGARSAGLAHASSTIFDEYAVFNNPGALGHLSSSNVSVGYLNLYGIEGMQSVFATVGTPFKKGYAALGVVSFGDEIYHSEKLSLGIGSKLGLAGLGLSINYHHYFIHGYGASGLITFDLGGLATLGPKIYVSGVLKNASQSRLSRRTGEYLPTILSTGVGFKPSDQVLLNAQYDKDLLYPGILRIGLEYAYSSLVFRTGVTMNPVMLSFGLGFHHKNFKFDYGLKNHPLLGQDQTLTLSYHFK